MLNVFLLIFGIGFLAIGLGSLIYELIVQEWQIITAFLCAIGLVLGIVFISVGIYGLPQGQSSNNKCKEFCISREYDLGIYISGKNNCLDGSICSCQCGHNNKENYEKVKYEKPKECKMLCSLEEGCPCEVDCSSPDILCTGFVEVCE